MVQVVEPGEAKLYQILSLVLRTVSCLHVKGMAMGECQFTFFTSDQGKKCNVGARLNRILRDDLRLGGAVTGTGVRRAIVDQLAGDPNLTEQQKRGALGSAIAIPSTGCGAPV